MEYFVYFARCKDGSLYAGYTTDVTKRIEEHNMGKYGAKYTKSRRPVVLAYQEQCVDRSSAMKREAQLKQLTREQKLALVS